MYPSKCKFKILNQVRKQQADDLRSYLDSLFDKTQLVAEGLMLERESLDFIVNDYTQGLGKDAWYDVYFVVTVSDRIPPDALFQVIVERFKSSDDERYVIGEPGSGEQNPGIYGKSAATPKPRLSKDGAEQ